ncbi:hypothetical protein Vretifemale_7487 [Volvox reticuliferus]|nr:hypothetical protein Vretifemale_7487 [Volvox reticuliferus]
MMHPTCSSPVPACCHQRGQHRRLSSVRQSSPWQFDLKSRTEFVWVQRKARDGSWLAVALSLVVAVMVIVPASAGADALLAAAPAVLTAAAAAADFAYLQAAAGAAVIASAAACTRPKCWAARPPP